MADLARYCWQFSPQEVRAGEISNSAFQGAIAAGTCMHKTDGKLFSLAAQIAVEGRSGEGRDAQGSPGGTAGKKETERSCYSQGKKKKCKIKPGLRQRKFYKCY